jgi:hypothetical protein
MVAMSQIKRFADWCREPSRIKVNRFRPTNSVVLISATILFSSILAVLFYQQASLVVVSIMNPVIWGGDEYESPRRILNEGDFIYVIGRTRSFGFGDSNVFLLKYNQDGELQWDVTWDNPSTDAPEEFAIYEDSIIITGVIIPDPDDRELILWKYDTEGMLIWNTTWGGVGWEERPSSDYGEDVEVLDGEIYVIGVTTHKASKTREQDILLLKYDANGELLWQKQYGENQTYEWGHRLEVLDDELYVASRRLTFNPDGDRLDELYLIKLDIEGNVLWNRTYDDINGDVSLSVGNMIIEDESIFVTGGINRKGTGLRLYLSKFDLNGGLQWVHILDEENYITRGGTVVVDDHILVMAGDRVNRSNTGVILFDFDQEGNLLGNFTWGTSKNETAWDMRVVGDRVYLMGQVSSSAEGEVDIYLTAIENPYASVDEPKRKGIPAFPVLSIIVGLGISSFLLKSRRLGE